MLGAIHIACYFNEEVRLKCIGLGLDVKVPSSTW